MSQSNRPPIWKQRFLILPRFQWSIILYFFIIFIQFIFILLYGLYRVHSKLSDNPMYLEAYYEALPFLYTTFIWITFFSLFAVVFGGIFVSHKAAGPIFRLHQVIKSLKNGNHQGEIKFREDDFFPEIERDLNELIKTLKK